MDRLMDGITILLILWIVFIFWLFDGLNMTIVLIDFIWTKVS